MTHVQNHLIFIISVIFWKITQQTIDSDVELMYRFRPAG
jgi:hypothetical protein